MAEQKYEIDGQGNLVERGGNAADEAEDAAIGAEGVVEGTGIDGVVDDGAATDRPLTQADRRRVLLALLASDVVGVVVLIGAGLMLPESRTILLALGAAYAIASVPIYLWMSRTTQQRVEADRHRQAAS